MRIYYSIKRRVSRFFYLLSERTLDSRALNFSFPDVTTIPKTVLSRQKSNETVAEMTCPDCKLRVFWSNEFKRYEHHYGNMDKNPMPCPAQIDTTEYPPEGQNVECNHDAFYMGDNGLPRHPLALADFVYCPTCGEKQ